MLRALFDCRVQMAKLWTSRTQDRRDVPLFNEHRKLLAEMSRDRTDAHERVIAVMSQLVKLSVDLSDLRQLVVQPVLVPEDGTMHCQVYLKGLWHGVHKLDAFRQDSSERCVFWQSLGPQNPFADLPHRERESHRRLVAESLFRAPVGATP